MICKYTPLNPPFSLCLYAICPFIITIIIMNISLEMFLFDFTQFVLYDLIKTEVYK